MILTMTLLLAGLQAEPAGQSTAPEPAKDKLICKRETPIGSLVPSRKMCLTKKQWQERAEIGNEVARRMIQEGMGNMNCMNSGNC